jgi:hypothetical protein
MLQSRATRQFAARAFDALFYRRVDLVLHRAITCPTGCHSTISRAIDAIIPCLVIGKFTAGT